MNLVRDWPDPARPNHNSDKVPTRLSYEDSKGSKPGLDCRNPDHLVVSEWGFGSTGPSTKHGFKLMIDPEYHGTKKLENIARADWQERISMLTGSLVEWDHQKWDSQESCRVAEMASRDYLRALWLHAEDQINRDAKGWDENHDKIFVLTVPAVWKQNNRERIKEAAIAAGLPGKIELVSEPEAAAHAVFQDLENRNEFKLEVSSTQDVQA